MVGYTSTPDFYNEFIAHHGVKGQKWGVKNGPPYPLDSEKKLYSLANVKSSVEKKSFKSPKWLSNHMKTFKYSEFSTLKSPEQVAKDKSGSCHDQVMYELSELRKQGKDPKATFWIELDPKTGQGGMTHAYVYYKEGKEVKYFENAWGGHEGIKSFKSNDDIMDFFEQQHKKGEKK